MNKRIKKTIIVFVIALLLWGFALIISGWDYLMDYCNAFCITGFSFICIGGLSFVSALGSFTTFGYSFQYIFKGTNKNKKYTNLREYQEQKESTADRLACVPYFIVGGLFAIIGLILLLIL